MNYISTETAAYLLGMPVRTLNHHVKADGAPRAGYNQYDPAALIQWYASHCRRLVEESRSGSSEREARRRIALAKAQTAELKAEELAGHLVRVEKVHDEYARVVASVKSKLLQLGGSVTAEVMAAHTPQAVQKIIDNAVWQALDDLGRTDLAPQKPVKKRKTRKG